ncbi:MAG: ATP-binding protein [Thermodesulfobacteriota bacterium]
MNHIRKKLATFFLKKADTEIGESSALKSRYKQFRLTLLVTITLIAMLPATGISVFGYFQYMLLLEQQERVHLNWHLEDSKQKLETFIANSPVPPSADELDRLLPTINAQLEIFLVDWDNRLVTSSESYGDKGDLCELNAVQLDDGISTVKKRWWMGMTFQGSAPLAGTDWILVLTNDGPLSRATWVSFQKNLVLTFVLFLGMGLLIIYQLVSILTSRIRESDAKRMALLSEAEHSDKLASIGRLAAGIAHEINNPLAVIDQKAGLIEDFLDFSEDFTHKDRLNRSILGIHEGVQRCKVITHRLLSFARRMESRLELIVVNDLILEVMGFLEKEALYHQIRVDLDLAEDLPQIESDHGQLQQIFLNIINNGIDAVGLDGSIQLTTQKLDDERVQVTVTDSGPGIEPEILKHIFDPFFTTKETGKGTGLGLSITYGLIQRLGGTIQVESEPGRGTSFIIALPVHHRVINENNRN